MKDIFNKLFIDYFNNDNIVSWITNKPINILNCYIFEQYLTNDEIKQMEYNLMQLIYFILKNDLLVFPSVISPDPKIYRAVQLKSVDRTNGYFPLLKSMSSQCNSVSNPNEPVWFSFKPLYNYLSLSTKNPAGIVSCRKIKDLTSNFKLNLVLNISTNIKVCNDSYLVNQQLQEQINKVILVLIVRKYCDYSKTQYPNNLTYEEIMSHPEQYTFIKTVEGYSCDNRYKGGSIYTLLQSWNYFDGTRVSVYNEDRIQIQCLFDIFELVEYIINDNENILSSKFIEYCNNHGLVNKFNAKTKINMLGWICQNTPNRNCKILPGEWALSYKYFKPPLRYDIFDQRNPECYPKFFVYTTSPPHYMEVDENEAIQLISTQTGGNNDNNNTNTIMSTDTIIPEKIKYEYSDKQENINSDIFKVFFDSSDEHLYKPESKIFANILKEYNKSDNSSILSPPELTPDFKKAKYSTNTYMKAGNTTRKLNRKSKLQKMKKLKIKYKHHTKTKNKKTKNKKRQISTRCQM